MVTPAPYTTGATIKAPRPSQADDRLLPPRRMMTAMEADAERRIGRALATMRRALLDGLTDDNAHLMLARLESEEVLRPFTDTVMAVLTDVSLAGAQWGAETVNRHAYGAKGVIDFVWDIVNEAAAQHPKESPLRLKPACVLRRRALRLGSAPQRIATAIETRRWHRLKSSAPGLSTPKNRHCD